ncbi:unnamed protein product, partial [Ectocarpus sp. 4 AP-2014]
MVFLVQMVCLARVDTHLCLSAYGMVNAVGRRKYSTFSFMAYEGWSIKAQNVKGVAWRLFLENSASLPQQNRHRGHQACEQSMKLNTPPAPTRNSQTLNIHVAHRVSDRF